MYADSIWLRADFCAYFSKVSSIDTLYIQFGYEPTFEKNRLSNWPCAMTDGYFSKVSFIVTLYIQCGYEPTFEKLHLQFGCAR